MSGFQPWEAQPYSAEAKRRSMEQAQRKIDAMKREERRQARICQCTHPVPGYPKGGQRACVICRRWIE